MGRRLTFGWVLVCIAVFFTAKADAGDSLVDSVSNPRWHFSDKLGLATFLGGDKPETAKLIVNKSKVLGQTVTVESDASYIVLQSGDSPHVIFNIPQNADGTSSKIVMTGGDQPSLFFNDKEQIPQQGKWIQVCLNKDAMLTIELGTTNFAKVKFESPATAAPVPAPPVLDNKVSAPKPPELLHPVTPDELRGAINNYTQAIHKKCVTCNGTGQISVKYQTGTQQQGIFSVPVYGQKQEKCTRCNGTGIDRAKDDVLVIMAGKIVKDLAALKKDDPKSPKILTDAYDEITKDMIGDQKSWKLLTANGRSILAQKSPTVDTTVVTLVEVKKSEPHNDVRRYLVRVLGTDREVFIDNPTLADELHSGRALMGGMVDDPVASANGEKKTVLRGGFLIAPPIEHGWWWWSKD